MIIYLDTSAALKLMFDEVESDPLAGRLDALFDCGGSVVAAMLLHTEMYCAARRRGVTDLSVVHAVIERITLIDMVRQDFTTAAALGGLRSADALHLAVAVRVMADTMIAYDRELCRAAAAHLPVESPT